MRWLDDLISELIFKYIDAHNPGLVIGNPDDPYLMRWYVIPNNRIINVYLHFILRDDDDRALHDHPWDFISIILKNSYLEHRFLHQKKGENGLKYITHYKAGSILFRTAGTAHRLQVFDKPVFSLVVTGPHRRSWGFWCPQGWRHWKIYTGYDETGDSAQIGRGCD